MRLDRKFWYSLSLCFIFLLAGCGAGQGTAIPSQPLNGDSLNVQEHNAPSPTPIVSIPRQNLIPATAKSPAQTKQTQPTQPYNPGPPPTNIPGTGSGPAPYGPPPAMTSEEIQLTQQLFNQINSDRAARGLYPFTWNAKLEGGARLHSWNMFHCGFSHTCPDGLNQCTRIANEGFTFTDCGECIGLAGPSTPPWSNIYAVQESMMNEGPGGWHFIHLTSTTLHRIGVGIYVDPNGWAWFTEDIVS